MKNKVKFLSILIITMIMITNISMAVDYTCKISLLSDKTEIKKGEAVIILVKATDIQAGEGIIAYNTLLEYNADVFDCKVSADEEGNWGMQGGMIENSLTMAKNDLLPSAKDQVIAKIVLTAKADAPIGNQKFKLKQIEFATEEGSFSIDDVETNVSIKEEKKEEDKNNTTNNTNTSNTNQNNTNTNGGNANKTENKNDPITIGQENTSKTNTQAIGANDKVDASTANKILPKTGIKGILIGAISIVIAVATVCYIKYRRAP